MSVSTIIIVGAGISGLATAHYIYQKAQSADKPVQCVVLEANSRLGGKILTERVGDIITEGGPESFSTRKPWALALCRELGLGDRLLGADDAGRNYVLQHGRPVQVPNNPRGFMQTPLLSLRGKLRAARELFVPAMSTIDDESLGGFIRRRFGDEVLERLVAPAVGGIYLSDVDQLSLRTSFDRFANLEQTHGSVLKGMLKMQRQTRQAPRTQASGSGLAAKPSPFVTLPNGMSEMVEALAGRLIALGCDLRTNANVISIDKQPSRNDYQVRLSGGKMLLADVVVLATPAPVMAHLLAPHAAGAAAHLRGVRYLDVATVALAYRRVDMTRSFEGFGFVVPASEQSPLLACEVISNKWPGHAPDDQVLVRAFLGGHRNEALMSQPAHTLIASAHAEIARIFGIRGQPVLSRVFKWQPGNPQYPVGHLVALERVEAQVKQVLANVFLTGAGMRGLGIPDCVKQAEDTARRVLGGALAQAQAQSTSPLAATAPA